VFYSNIDKAEDLPKQEFQLSRNINIRESKWTHHHLTTEETELLQKFKKQLNITNDYCSSKAGIVTGANDYFIVDIETAKKYQLSEVTRKIIQKGAFVNGSVVFGHEEFDRLVDQSKPAFLMAINNSSDIVDNQKIQEYFAKGIEQKIDKRYKSTLRKNWYEVPNVMPPAEILFFKRCNEYPKLIKNEADVLNTDSAYSIKMAEGYEPESLIFSFYNSITLAFAELNGRYYGGGVLELTPNEFKNLPVPYLPITHSEFHAFAKEFKNKSSIAEICKQNDARILRSVDANIDSDTLKKLLAIRDKLYQRRMKTN
jgi:adenine-specific DNA-methyltransferase